MSPRTLRRRLQENDVSYRKLLDEVRMHVAIKYLLDTVMTVEDIADALGFSEFRRISPRISPLDAKLAAGVPQRFEAPKD